MLCISYLSIFLWTILHQSPASALPYSNGTSYDGEWRGVRAVLPVNFPDPSIIQVDGVWFAFATSGDSRNIQVAVSSSFVHHAWVPLSQIDVLPDAGKWAINDNVWAPDLVQLDDDLFVMYFAAPIAGNSRVHCIGAATSTSILGPYNPVDVPFACPVSEGGAIDPAGFIDPQTDKMYVVYKVDGNSLNTGDGPCNGPGPEGYHATPIRLQQVSRQDGLTAIGEATDILDRDEDDGPLVEAPSIFYNEGYQLYFLTFSSNCYCTDQYDISFAYSFDLEGIFHKSSYPLLTTPMRIAKAPGGADVTPDGRFALFHGTIFNNGSGLVRHLYAAEADVDNFDLLIRAIL